ncbi:hypothetical protein C1882_28895, partial [Pseudomonas sp. FW305-E2]|uniref:hypothetical protein n=1 Tax=Pseudomonas sp. FW305-E2 TaxID=2075558 RepID=UPI000CD3A29D
ISRRQFARRAALLSASATLAPAANVFAQPSPAIPAQDSAAPHLSPESQTEADARLRQILAQYGTRFSEDDKKTLQQLNLTTQQSLDRV